VQDAQRVQRTHGRGQLTLHDVGAGGAHCDSMPHRSPESRRDMLAE
jgi:hypothetical protein